MNNNLAMPQPDLFSGIAPALREGINHLHGHASADADDLLAFIAEVERQAPFRHMMTPGGHAMSAAMTSAGLGWVTDRKGYRYTADDPVSGEPWPALPSWLSALAGTAAQAAGFAGFVPDACLINRYAPGARMGLHQDTDEADRTAPIVSVSLGLSAVFLFGGDRRSDPVTRIVLSHGDVVVWGGPARHAFHGIAPLKPGHHPKTGALRYNLTLRKAL